MSLVDVSTILHELPGDTPCGPNLEYDPAFLELEQATLGKPEVQYGDTITPAVPPVKKLSLELIARSRDLRIAMPLLRSLLALHGMAGFADGVKLIERLLAERWDSVHPQLDPDDGLDPMLRINSLATLADAATVLRELKECAFVQLPGLGPLTLRGLRWRAASCPHPMASSSWPWRRSRLRCVTSIPYAFRRPPRRQRRRTTAWSISKCCWCARSAVRRRSTSTC